MSELPEFKPWPSISRLMRDVVVTEKIDGTNAQVYISDDLSVVAAGSRTRWITPELDNYGFARWVQENRDELLKLGPGHHYGEWWGRGIQRGYGLKERRFSLFNTTRWSDPAVRPSCCHTVPILYTGSLSAESITAVARDLVECGSAAAPGYMKPEGLVVFHTAANVAFKFTFDGDGHKSARQPASVEAR